MHALALCVQGGVADMRHCARHEPAPHCNVAANAVSFMPTLQGGSVNLQVETGAASDCAGHCSAAIQHSNTARASSSTLPLATTHCNTKLRLRCSHICYQLLALQAIYAQDVSLR